MATLTLLPDTGHHHQQQQAGHHHAKKKCTSATCCSPSRIWRSIQQLIGDNNKQDLITLCQDPNRASHVLRVLLSSRLTNDASLYPASNKHRVIQLVDDGSSGLSPLHFRATVNANFGKTATDLNALQLALFHRNEGIACYLLQLVRQYAGDKDLGLFVNHLWGTRNGSLHLACFLGMPRVVQLLLEMGVAPDAVNGKLKTPLDCCVDFNGDDVNGGQPSVLDCRTLIEHALLVKHGKKLSVDASSPSPSLGVGVVVAAPATPEQKPGDNVGDSPTTTALMDDTTSKNECVVDSKDAVQADGDFGVTADGDVKSSLDEAMFFAPGQVVATVMSPLAGGDDDPDIHGHDEVWCLPLLLTDSPFAFYGDSFASDDEAWSLPLLFMDSPFASYGDPFASDDEKWSPPLLLMDSPFASDDPFDSDDEVWSLPLLLMDDPFASDDPFATDDDTGDSTCSKDDDGLVPGVSSASLVMDSHGKCSVHLHASDGATLLTGGYYDDNPSGGIASMDSSLVDSGGHGDPSMASPSLVPTGHSRLLFGMDDAPDPKAQHSPHQAYSDPRVTTKAASGTRLRGRIRSLDPTTVEHGKDTSWLHPHHSGGTGDPRHRSLLYSFVKQFKANLKSNDWKALRHESTLSERKNPNYDLVLDVLAGLNGDVGVQDNPNTEQMIFMIARALHTTTKSPSTIPLLNQCNFTERITTLESLGTVHCLPLMVGGDT